MAALSVIELFTDGACSGNPGPGGYGAILRFTGKDGQVHEKEMSEGFPETTNNRMEILAAIVGLENLTRPCRVIIYSDSQYLCNAFNLHWIDGWKKVNFREGKKDEVKNKDLWERLLRAMAPHEVTYVWVKGHAGHPENERCDRLAVAAYQALQKENLPS